MVTYEVTISVRGDLVDAYERYMRQQHIPNVLATRCFAGAVFTRAAPGRYRARYEAPTQGDLDRYLASHATRLRRDFTEHFPTGISMSREVWVVLQSWNAPSRAAR